MFRRKRRADEPDELDEQALDEQAQDEDRDLAAAGAAATDVAAGADPGDHDGAAGHWDEGGGEDEAATRVEIAGGPYDSEDVPADGVPRLDLGGMLIPILDGMEVRVDVDPQGQVVAATLVDGDSMMQLGAFAAPRTAGIWGDVRTEIADSLRSVGGSAEEVEGAYGTELNAQVPTESGPAAPARFLGIDRPRWFLRALLSGSAAIDPGKAERLEAALGLVVIVRGTEAMPIRDQIPLRLPPEAMDAAAAQAAAAEGGPGAQADSGRPDLGPLERGPEITETR